MFSLLIVSLHRHRQTGTMERADAASRRQAYNTASSTARRGFEAPAAFLLMDAIVTTTSKQ
jgi:hypothetical protein